MPKMLIKHTHGGETVATLFFSHLYHGELAASYASGLAHMISQDVGEAMSTEIEAEGEIEPRAWFQLPICFAPDQIAALARREDLIDLLALISPMERLRLADEFFALTSLKVLRLQAHEWALYIGAILLARHSSITNIRLALTWAIAEGDNAAAKANSVIEDVMGGDSFFDASADGIEDILVALGALGQAHLFGEEARYIFPDGSIISIDVEAESVMGVSRS